MKYNFNLKKAGEVEMNLVLEFENDEYKTAAESTIVVVKELKPQLDQLIALLDKFGTMNQERADKRLNQEERRIKQEDRRLDLREKEFNKSENE